MPSMNIYGLPCYFLMHCCEEERVDLESYKDPTILTKENPSDGPTEYNYYAINRDNLVDNTKILRNVSLQSIFLISVRQSGKRPGRSHMSSQFRREKSASFSRGVT